MLSDKEQVAVCTQGRRSWPRDSPSASRWFFPRPLDVHSIVPVILRAGRDHAPQTRGAWEGREQSVGPRSREPWFPWSNQQRGSIPDDLPVTGSRLFSVRAPTGHEKWAPWVLPLQVHTCSLLSISSSAASIYLLSVGQ